MTQPHDNRPTLRLNDAADLIAAVPAFIGYTPQDSLVLLWISAQDRITLAARTHLPADASEAEFLTRALLAQSRNAEAHRAVALVVETTATPGDLPHRTLIDTLTAEARQRGITIGQALWAPTIGPGATYVSYTDPDCAGTQTDPATSAITTAIAVLADTHVRASREDLAAEFATNPITDPDTLMELTLQANARAPRDDAAATAHHLARLHTAIADAQRGALPDTAEQLAELVAALADHHARDAALCVPGTAAEELWLHLLRRTPGPDRAESACAYAARTYLRGDGTRTRMALETSLTADPDHRLANLMAHALAQGVPPEMIAPLFPDTTAPAEPSATNACADTTTRADADTTTDDRRTDGAQP